MAQLRHAGFEVEHAHGGAVAEFLLIKQAWGLCMLDLGLPLVNGLTVLQRARQRKPELPVLVLTALDDLHGLVAGLNAGADDSLIKPLDFPELEARRRALLLRSPSHCLLPPIQERAAVEGMYRQALDPGKSSRRPCQLWLKWLDGWLTSRSARWLRHRSAPVPCPPLPACRCCSAGSVGGMACSKSSAWVLSWPGCSRPPGQPKCAWRC